jgi:hypothetical protein
MIKRWIGHAPNTGIGEGTTTGSGNTTGKAVEMTRRIDDATLDAIAQTRTETIPGGKITDVVICSLFSYVPP